MRETLDFNEFKESVDIKFDVTGEETIIKFLRESSGMCQFYC